MNAITAEGLTKVYRLRSRGPVQRPTGGASGILGRLGLKMPPRRGVREIYALNDVSLQVEPGTILGVLGRNGAGKTTLLKLLARVSLPTAGRAIVRGRTVSLLGIGQGFQSHLSGRDNIFLHAALYGVSRAEVLEMFDQIVDFAGLGRFIDEPVSRYSSGMYLRLAFSVAVNMRPDVILADEVLAVGDIEFQERCLRRVAEAGTEGVSVLFVSHDMEAVTRLCHRAIRLDGGQIVDAGRPQDVVTRYQASIENGEGLSEGKTSPYVELLSLQLTSPDDLEIGAPRDSEEFMVRATIRTLAPNVRLWPVLSLRCEETLVLWSSPPRPTFSEEPGVQIVSVRIPAHLLADRVYQARLRLIVEHGEDRSVLNRDTRLTFRVYGDALRYDAQADQVPWKKAMRPGLVAPRLDWVLTGDRPRVQV